MIDVISSFFRDRITANETEPDHEHALRLATAALLVEVSRADFHVGSAELAATTTLLTETFDLTGEETEALVTLATKEADASISLHPFTRLINEQYEYADKLRVLELMWKVAYADGVKSDHEEHLIRKVANLLHVPHSQFVRTRLAVSEQNG